MMKLPPQVSRGLDLLESAGYEAYLVGGAVRDEVRGVSPAKDWDMTTSARPEQIMSVFQCYRLIETGAKHGTVTVLLDQVPLEITTYRVDGDYSDHRHPDGVSFASTLREDLERRDFTMNALAYHPKKGVIDLVGGVEDIASGVIRCVGDPDRRFREDALRMLRALRFASTLKMSIEENTAAAVHRNRHLLQSLAPERVQVELTKLLCGEGVSDVLRSFADVLAEILPELAPMFGFQQHNPHHDRDVWEHTIAVVSSIAPEPALRWAALLHDVGKPPCFTIGADGVGHFYGHAEQSTALAEDILSRLRLDNASKERILRLVRYHDLPLTLEQKSVKRLLNKHGIDVVRQLIELHRADTMGLSAICQHRLAELEQVSAVVDSILQEEACFSLRDLAVNGNDLTELGLHGRAVGQALRDCLNAVMDERVPNERKALLDFVQSRNMD